MCHTYCLHFFWKFQRFCNRNVEIVWYIYILLDRCTWSSHRKNGATASCYTGASHMSAYWLIWYETKWNVSIHRMIDFIFTFGVVIWLNFLNEKHWLHSGNVNKKLVTHNDCANRADTRTFPCNFVILLCGAMWCDVKNYEIFTIVTYLSPSR